MLSPPSCSPGSDRPDALALFRQLVVDDARLFAQLENTASVEDFAAKTVELGEAHGLIFRSDDVKAALLNARRAWFEKVKL